MSLKLVRIERLKELMRLRGLNGPTALGVAINKSTAQTANLLAGIGSFGEKVARSIEEYAGLPLGWLDTLDQTDNTEPGPLIRGRVPLLSPVQAGMYKEYVDNFHPGDGGMELIPTSVPVKKHTFALRVTGDSMEPMFQEGMLLIVEPELEALPGDFVIAKTASDESTFKQLVRDGDEWFLKPLNERYPIRPLGNASIVGVVRAVERRFR